MAAQRKQVTGQARLPAAVTAVQEAYRRGGAVNSPDQLAGTWRTMGSIIAAGTAIEIDGVQLTPTECFNRSIEMYQELGAEWEMGHTLSVWARYERQFGRPELGVEKWQAARRIFVRLGSDLEVIRMDQEYRAHA